MVETMTGWHWIKADRTLRTGEVVEAGHSYLATGPLVMCRNGMHASRRALDALQYAPGPIICRVKLRGEVIHQSDKSVARERRVLWLADATTLLHQFACAVAAEALALTECRGERVDPRSWAAIHIKERWLRGLATDAELSAARATAWVAAVELSAARDAAWDAARDAAWVAAWGAARDAAWAAAWAAAWDAARDAAWGAARDAAWGAQNLMLKTMLFSLKEA